MQTEAQVDMHEIEVTIEQAKMGIAFGEAIERLHAHPDFQLVVLEGLFEKEAVRLVHLKADPEMKGAEHQAEILRDIDAIGALRFLLKNKAAIAENLKAEMPEYLETQTELLAEEVE